MFVCVSKKKTPPVDQCSTVKKKKKTDSASVV